MKILARKSDADIKACREAQAKYCKENCDPHFAPESGVCWSCRKDIYQNYGWTNKGEFPFSQRIGVSKDGEQVDFITGISLEKAGSELVTGCPHCNRSYCD
ncbi:hypothetical protein SPSIL_014880 [Sporomusa silvacetica DSM 10669]|uniref:Uncharacterized protein n=1 Tax=Sporomusa silvacetica DSM 10669 TaxID=1123289 RepID=A0ABZ3IIZ5_9FIRM|nr:hypothetical protein [Sporomusa silvacetica]OZC21550.1 hypothetical protein SPSIL_09610 [Sporomusa silvacetica DSM 10669]